MWEGLFTFLGNLKPQNSFEFMTMTIGLVWCVGKILEYLPKRELGSANIASKDDVDSKVRELESSFDKKIEKKVDKDILPSLATREEVSTMKSEHSQQRADINNMMETVSQHKVELKGVSKDIERLFSELNRVVEDMTSVVRTNNSKIDEVLRHIGEHKNGN